MGLQSPVRLAPYDPGREAELVAMWRERFEFGVGVRDPHPFDEQVGDLRDHVPPSCEARIALDGPALVGFIAATSTRIDQLQVRVVAHRRGVGTALLDWAKKRSSGSLQLHAFARDRVARASCERHGLVVERRGSNRNGGSTTCGIAGRSLSALRVAEAARLP